MMINIIIEIKEISDIYIVWFEYEEFLNELYSFVNQM